MTERRGFYVRTEVGVEGRLRPNRRTEGASKKSKGALSAWVPVPQTDTGSWAEDAKVRERIMVKELGKMTL